MGIIESFLPYGILLLASVVSFFKKGDIENKIAAIIFFIAGVTLIAFVEGFWWRLLVVFITASIPSTAGRSRSFDRNAGTPIHNLMCVALLIMMVCEWVIGEVIDHQPTVLMTIGAIFYGIVIFFNVDSK